MISEYASLMLFAAPFFRAARPDFATHVSTVVWQGILPSCPSSRWLNISSVLTAWRRLCPP